MAASASGVTPRGAFASPKRPSMHMRKHTFFPAAASFAAVEGRILEGVDVAVDAGETPCRDASTIVSFQHGGLQILRQGALPASEIERVLSDPMQ